MSGFRPALRMSRQAQPSDFSVRRLRRRMESYPMQLPTNADLSVASSIAWFYVVANSLRGFTYIPQIVAAWRSRDGAKSLSLLTWSAWLVANFAAVLYGLVLRDAFFTSISLINCTGCALVTCIAARRRWQWTLASRVSSIRSTALRGVPGQTTNRPWRDVADAHLARCGCNRPLIAADVTTQTRNARYGDFSTARARAPRSWSMALRGRHRIAERRCAAEARTEGGAS